MPQYLGLVSVGAASLAAFGFSLFRARRERFEAPFVIFSLLSLGRLAGELASFAYSKDVGRAIPFLPNECLPCLAFYPTLAGLARFVRKAYGAKGSEGRPGSNRLIAMSIPIMLYDALNCAIAALSGTPFAASAFAAVSAAVPPIAIAVGMAALGFLGMAASGASFLFPRRVSE